MTEMLQKKIAARAFLAVVVVTGLLIAIFGVNWMRSPIEEKTSPLLATSSDVILKFSEPLPRIQSGAVTFSSMAEDKDRQMIATGAGAIAVDAPQLLRKNMVRAEVRPERTVFRPEHTISSRKNLLPGLSAIEFAQEVSTISDAQIDRLAETFGAAARERLSSWRTLMSSPRNRAAAERQKVELVNDFMKRTPFRTDQEHWGREDYWAMPIEFLSTHGGDCEDFAIAKYFTLRALGVPEEKLQITYVIKQVNLDNEAHMVLAYFPAPDAEPLILDNLNKRIHPASVRNDLVPVYSFNGSGLWLAKAQSGRGQAQGSSNRIVQWKELQARMKSAA